MAMRIIQVAGTKAKGSVSTFLANIVSAAGYKCGLFVSPHVQREEERISIDGEHIPTGDMLRLLSGGTESGYYRKFFQAAMAWFEENQVDVAVMETGLGGRFDPVSALDACETVLTHFGLDHTEILGDTIEQIALEKCRTIRQSGYVISMPQPENAMKIIESTCELMNARLVKIEEADIVYHKNGTFDFKEFTNLRINVLGRRQYVNAATAVMAAHALYHVGVFITTEHMRKGLERTVLLGRQQYVEEQNLLIDGSHNIDSFEFLEETLKDTFAEQDKVFLVSAMKEKDLSYLANIARAEHASVYITQMDYGRAMKTQALKKVFDGVETYVVPSVEEAFEASLAHANKEDALLVATGSIYLAGEILDLLEECR